MHIMIFLQHNIPSPVMPYKHKDMAISLEITDSFFQGRFPKKTVFIVFNVAGAN